MRTSWESKTEYMPGRIQERGRRLAVGTMPYGLPPCVVRGLLRRRAGQLPEVAPTRASQSEAPLKELLRRMI
jgi:hypothetical protein